MVDLMQFTRNGDTSKIKSFMGRTPGIIKSKILTALGSSTELINGISNKLDINLSFSSSSSSDLDERESKNDHSNGNFDRQSIDISSVDFISRKAKERRAHEEILSGRFRHPNFISKSCKIIKMDSQPNQILESSSDSSYNISIDSKSPVKDDSGLEEELKFLNGIPQEITPIVLINPTDTSIDHNVTILDNNQIQIRSNSSTLTSLHDPPAPSTSIESSDLKVCIQSESENSFPSWASSMSLDSQTEENIKSFMKKFIEILFTNSLSIGLELKSEFGQMARLESGRLWFSRLISAQRAKSKCVNETTFYSLIQHFAIVLFECAESDDFSPAKILMNMCFTFYHEIEVPGCDPYREYLFTYLRQQPIWHTLRFWNAAFFDAIQCERAHLPVPIARKSKYFGENCGISQCNEETKDLVRIAVNYSDVASLYQIKDDQKFQQNIAFAQLAAFTCNMHAFGLSKTLCLEFLKKHCTIANLSEDEEIILKDSINRIYMETEKWGA